MPDPTVRSEPVSAPPVAQGLLSSRRPVDAPSRAPAAAPARRPELARSARRAPRCEPHRRPPAAASPRGGEPRHRQTVRHGVGRPRHLYDVTAEAQDLFPSNYDALATGLLAAIEAVGGDDLLDQVFAARRRQLGERVREQMADRVGGRAAGRPRPRAGGRPGRPGLSRRHGPRCRRHDPPARAQLRDLPHRRGLARRLPGGARAVHARSSAPTSSASRTSQAGIAAAPIGSAKASGRHLGPGVRWRVRRSLTHLGCVRSLAPAAFAGPDLAPDSRAGGLLAELERIPCWRRAMRPDRVRVDRGSDHRGAVPPGDVDATTGIDMATSRTSQR